MLLSFTEHLMTYALGPPRRSRRHAGRAPHHSRRGKRNRRSRRSCWAWSPARCSRMGRWSRAVNDRRTCRSVASAFRRHRQETVMHVDHRKAPRSPHGPEGHGRHRGAAVPRRDGAGAALSRADAQKLRLVAIEMVHGAAAAPRSACRRTCGRRRRPGAAFDLSADRARAARSRSANT